MSDIFIPDPGFGSFNDDREAQEYAQFHELSNRIQHVSNVAPYLAGDAEVLTAIANMPVPTENLGYMAGTLSAQMRLDGTLEDLERMEPGRARRVYSQMTPTQQEALRQAGYQPPGSDNGGSNPVLSALGQTGGLVLGGLNTAITKTPIVSDVFDIMIKLENGVKTLYRGVRTDEEAALATGIAIAGAVGIAAAPFTGGLSLGMTALAAGAGGLAAGTAVTALTNPTDWIESLHDNWNGETVFSRGAQDRARVILRNSGLDTMARDIGWEMDPWETVKLFASTPDASSDQQFMASIERVVDRIAQPGDPRRQEVYGKLTELVQLPEFRQAVEVLQHSKVSFGRDIARFLNMDPGDPGYGIVSGAMDGLFTIVMDPTLAAGAAVKWRHARRFGIPIDPNDVTGTINAISRRANEIPAIGRAYDEIAHAVNTDQPHLLWRRVRSAKGMYDDLWNYKELKREAGELVDNTFTREDIFSWMKEHNNHQLILRGHGVQAGQGRLLLPSYGWRVPLTQEVVAGPAKLLEGAKAFIDFADDAGNQAHLRKVARQLKESGENLSGEVFDTSVRANSKGALRYFADPADEWRNVQRFVEFVDHIPVANRLMRGTGSVLASFTEMMPASRAISMVGPQSAEDIQRLVGLGRTVGISSTERKAWFNHIMQQDNIEHRNAAAVSFLDTMLTAGGARSTDHANDLTERFITKMKQRYSLGSADQYLFGERTASRALHPYQHTFDLPIPDLKALRQHAEKSMLLKYVYQATDLDFVDTAINKVWKPLVLLRIGFITRAAGEELLALMARAGPSSLLSEFGARSIAEGRLHSKALIAAKQNERLPAEAIRAIERMRYAAHVRPFERLFANYDWASPFNDVLRKYTDFLRHTLENGLAPGLETALPASRQLALLGKQGGFRRSLLTGVDPDLIRYAESFGRVHASTIMREMSSHNANIWSGTTTRDKTDFRMRYSDEAGELQELGFMVERGKFRIYERGDPLFDRAAHGGTAKILNDEVTGPVYQRVTSRWAPPNVTDDVALGTLNHYRTVEDWRVRSVLDELLTHTDARTTNWESLLRNLENSEPDLAAALRAKHRTIGTARPDADAVLDTVAEWVRRRYTGRGPFSLSRHGEAMMEQVTNARILLDELDTMDGATRAWYASYLDTWGHMAENPSLIHSFDDYIAELKLQLADRHYDPEVQGLVNNLTYVNRLDDGRLVARPPREGRTRLYVPQLTAETYGLLLAELRTAGGQQFINRMMNLWGDAQPHLAGLHIQDADIALHRFLNRLALGDPALLARHAADVAAAGTHGDLIPLSLMGFDDPDVALRFSQFLNGVLSKKGDELSMVGRMRANSGYVAFVDLDDHLRNYWPTDIDGAKRPIAHPIYEHRIRYEQPAEDAAVVAIDERVRPRETERVMHSWALDMEMITPRTHSLADQELITLPSGRREFGVDPREALQAGVEKMATDWLAHISPGTMQKRIVKGKVYADEDQLRQIAPGTELAMGEQAYDAKGRLLEFDDQDAFTMMEPVMGQYVHENWTMLGPLLRDAADNFRGTARLLPDTRDIRNLPRGVRDQRGLAAPLDGPNAREFRGHWSHVSDLKNGPQVAIGPSMVPIQAPSRWDQVLEFGFEKVISPAIDAIVRRPMAFHHYAEAMRENERALRWSLSKHIFGDPSAKTPGELHERLKGALDHPALTVSDDALAVDLKILLPVLMPDDFADLQHLQPLEMLNAFYGKYGDDVILRGSLDQQLTAAHKMLDEHLNVQRLDAVTNAAPGDRIDRAFKPLWKATRGQPQTRLYRVGEGVWSPRKPRKTDGVTFIDVPKDRVSSTLTTLNGPTPSKNLPTFAEVQRRMKAEVEKAGRTAYDAIEQGARGARPSLAGPDWQNVTWRKGRQRQHIYSREGFIRSTADGGLPPDLWAQEYMINTGMDFPDIESALDHYFGLVDHYLEASTMRNQAAMLNVADELGLNVELIDNALDAGNAAAYKQLVGDRPPGGRAYDETVQLAQPWSPDLPAPQALGPDQRQLLALLDDYRNTGKKHKVLEGIPDSVLDRAAKQLQHIDDNVRRTDVIGGHTIDRWFMALEAGDRAKEFPKWTLPVRNNPQRQAEGLLDAYVDHLGDDVLRKSWDEAQRHLASLPAPLREVLDKNSWSVLSAAHANKARMQDVVEALSAERAIRNSIPYIDSHEIRSQAGEYVRGFFPFMYAEENFLKRWGRTLRVAPDALRKGQLVYQGLKSGGVIRTDSQGRDWYVYPGAGLLAETVNRTSQTFGFGEVMPSGVVFATETKNILPGFDVERTGMPSANPLVAVPLGMVANNFHELRPIQEALVGQAGLAQSGVTQFVPASFRRFYETTLNEESSVRYASAMMQAIAVLEHNGHGLTEGATPNQLDDYIRRVRNHTRGILATQAFWGFVMPGSPSAQFTGESGTSFSTLTGINHEIPADIFRQEYLELVQELGIEDGTIRYFELNPDHDIYDLMPFTVGQSTTSGGAPLPATHEAVQFADENTGFIEQYPMASAWLLPQPDPGQPDFDEYAYVQQSLSGLRQKRTPTEFLEALKYREGSFDYFQARERHEQLMQDAEGNPMRRKVLTDVWNTYKAQHVAMHPVFGEQLEGGESRARRGRVLDELRTAIEDPAVPQVGHLAPLRDLIKSFDFYKLTISQMSEGRSDEEQQRVDDMKLTFENLVTDFLVEHPELQPLWLSVLRPEANL